MRLNNHLNFGCIDYEDKKIQPILSSKFIATSKKSLKPRKLPNSVSTYDETFQKGGGLCIQFYEPDLLKMAKMSLEECKKYREYLISSGKFYETTVASTLNKLPAWIQKAIKK